MRFGGEDGSESSHSSPPKPPFISSSKPEDPGSPELKRLALILREAGRMIARLEKRN